MMEVRHVALRSIQCEQMVSIVGTDGYVDSTGGGLSITRQDSR